MNKHYEVAAVSRTQLATEEIANEHYVSEAGITDETMQFSALNRIAEATLALAYEQARAADEARTANLIAALAQVGEQTYEWAKRAQDFPDSDEAKQLAQYKAWGRQVEERLGLA